MVNQTFLIGIDDDGDGVDADHAVILALPHSPHREVPVLLVKGNEGVDEPRHSLRHENRVERMRGAERVPQGERRVVSALGDVYLVICAAILAVDIGLDVRLDEEVVESGVS